VYVTTDAAACERAHREGLPQVQLSQWAAGSGALAEPLPAAACRHAVSFVGSSYGNRPRWIRSLRERGIAVECFGHGWPRGPVDADDIPRIMRESAISLNFGDSPRMLLGWRAGHSRQIKARVFEVPGAGGLLLTEPVAGLERYYDVGQELQTFATADELAAHIRHLLAHPAERDAMARRGHARTCAEHTYERRFAPILERAVAVARERDGVPLVETDLLAHLSMIEERHRRTPGLSALRAALIAPCRLAWGPVRGPRAARRAAFEVGWRIAGRHTYSAAGWPGRMFYREG